MLAEDAIKAALNDYKVKRSAAAAAPGKKEEEALAQNEKMAARNWAFWKSLLQSDYVLYILIHVPSSDYWTFVFKLAIPRWLKKK